MLKNVLRVLFAVEFLVALMAAVTLWAQVGGQSHLDLVYWAWKLGIGVGVAAIAVGITVALVNSNGRVTRGVVLQGLMLLVLMTAAGLLSYQAHLNEPDDDDDDDASAVQTVLPL